MQTPARTGVVHCGCNLCGARVEVPNDQVLREQIAAFVSEHFPCRHAMLRAECGTCGAHISESVTSDGERCYGRCRVCGNESDVTLIVPSPRAPAPVE